jgi:calcium/calmodulin-dependent protein kinase I
VSELSLHTNENKNHLFTDKYLIGEILGQGGYSVVRKATRLSDKLLVAVKIFTRSELPRGDESQVRSELEILLSLDHPNIVKVLDFFEEDQYFYIVLEYMSGGELFDRLMEKDMFTEGEARDLAVSIFKAIKYCHDRDIIHRFCCPYNCQSTQ